MLGRHPLEIDESVRKSVCMDVLALHSYSRKDDGDSTDAEVKAFFGQLNKQKANGKNS